MEISIQTPIPNSPNQPESTDFKSKLPISDQGPEISGTGDGDGPLKDLESPAQIGNLTSGGDTPATPELETPKKELENSNSDLKTATPVGKTEDETEERRILAPKNGSMDRLKVPKSPNPAGKANSECKTPTPVKQTGQRQKFCGIELPKNGTPNRLKVPKAFKYPERYMSPTDLMMSPISKGLLARTRKGAAPSKMHELRIPEMSLVIKAE